jgi:transposase
MKVIGKKKVRCEMEFIPAKLVMKEYIQYVYKCTECGNNDENPDDVIYSAAVPAPVLMHSIASPSIVAWIMYQKYMLSMPLYRQERDFRRMGAALKRDTMANWVILCADYWLKPLYERMHKYLLKCSIIMSDETTWQVNHEEGKKEIADSGGAVGRAYCDKIFRMERKWKVLTPEERKTNRLIYSVPVLDAFFAWAEKTITSQDNLKKALKYTLNHKKYFTNFLLDGRIPLSNNLSEIAVKPVAVTRKNALFSDSVEGAKATAIVFSIIGTATANNLDAYKYLEYIFRKLPNLRFTADDPILDEYLPWSEKVQLECRIQNTETDESKKEEPCIESA